MTPALIGILIYVIAQLAIGVIVSRRIRTQEDYLVAGRRLGYGLAIFTIFATWFGAETCISSAGQVYTDGVSLVNSEPFGYGACLLLMGLVFAVPLWRRRLTTLADLFRSRFSPGVERLAVLMMVPTSVLWAAAQIRAFGQVVAASSDAVDVEVGIYVAAAAVITYTVFGGLLADAITDLVQGIALIIGLVIIFISLAAGSGGDGELSLAAIDASRISFFPEGRLEIFPVLEDWAIPICGSLVAQELVARIIATRSPQVARRSTVIAGSSYILFGLIPVLAGLIGPAAFANLEDPEQILPLIAQRNLNVFFYALFAGALVSAILSTVDSVLLAAASLTSQNLIVSFAPGLQDRTKLLLARAGVIGFGIIATILALLAEGVGDLVEEASSLGSAGLFVIFVFGLLTRLGGIPSAFASLVAGMAVYILLRFLLPLYDVEFDYPFLGSLAAALAAYLAAAPAARPAAGPGKGLVEKGPAAP